MFNALQPGVFSLSGWDLLGMLTLDPAKIAPLLATGDTRWIHRSAYDLMGFAPDAVTSGSGMPRGRSLYGTLPDQLKDANSFASRLRRVLEVRSTYGIASGTQLDVPVVDTPSVLVLVHGLEDGTQHVTVLNFSREIVATTVRSAQLIVGATVVDMSNGEELGVIDLDSSVLVRLGPFKGRSLHIRPA
jgi:trehalose synthase